MRNQALLVAVAIATIACTKEPAPAAVAEGGGGATKTVVVRTVFDGGYAFAYDRSKETLQVAEIKDATHPMRLRVGWGLYDDESGDIPPTDPVLQTWDLSKGPYDISIEGATNGTVSLPKPNAVTTCDRIANKNADNLALIPDIIALAKAAGASTATLDTTRSKYGHRVNLTSGTLKVERAASCFEFKDGSTSMTKYRLAAGVLGVQIYQTVTADVIRLKLTDTAGASFTIAATPELNIYGTYEVVFDFGELTHCAHCSLGLNDELKDFDRFYGLLSNGPATAKKFKPYKASLVTNASPGDECPPGWFWVN